MSNAIEGRAFDHRTRKDGTVEVTYYGRPVTTLRGKEAAKFSTRISALDETAAQHLMARVTGNFKRGNERKVVRGR